MKLNGRKALQVSEIAVTTLCGKRWKWHLLGDNSLAGLFGDFRYEDDVISHAFAHGYGTVIHNGKRIARKT